MMRSAERNQAMHDFSPEEKQRFAYIEGREDLFETKLLSVENENSKSGDKKILIATRDPGSANALIPIIEALNEQGGATFFILTDGRAQGQIQEKFKTHDVTPEGMVLQVGEIIGTPDIIITDPSTSEQGLETFCGSTYHDVPLVLVEDYYTSALGYLRAAKERDTGEKNLRIPDVICSMDEEGKKLTTNALPDLAERIVVTGQPSFDRIALEDTERIRSETRRKLGIPEGTPLISYMSQMEPLPMIEQLAENINGTHGANAIIFRRHPRDNRSYQEYEKVFQDHGINLINSIEYTTAEVNAASDIVVTGWSTEGLNAIYRGKPTIHITDSELQDIPDDLPLPLPPVKLGASIGITHVRDLAAQIDTLRNPEDSTKNRVLEAIEKYYPKDGQNTQRVLSAIREKTGVVL